MGLDMYLDAKVYIGGSYHKIKQKKLDVSTQFIGSEEENDFTDCKSFPTEGIDEIVYRAGYWRKANHIHGWFVDNVQEGIDDCKQYDVSCEQLKELKSICEQLLSSKDKKEALEKLPIRGGFFFGHKSEEEENFWEDYWYDLELTLKNVNNALSLMEKYGADITYQSSW